MAVSLAALCTFVAATTGALAGTATPQPVETLAFGPLWRAAVAATAGAADNSVDLVRSQALGRWANSGEADADLLLVVDQTLEATGNFIDETGPVDAGFVDDALARADDATARVVFASLVERGLSAPPPDLGAAARRLYPGRGGLEALLASVSTPPPQAMAAALLAAYGLSGATGGRYIHAHPRDTAIVEALAVAARAPAAALALWRQLDGAADQLAFLAAWPSMAPPGAEAMLPRAGPYAREALLIDLYAGGGSGTGAIVPAFDHVVDRYGVSHTLEGVPMALMQAALAADPHGYLARSVAAYDRVRRAPYFGLERCHGSYTCWPYVYGPAQYDPARGLRLWPGFLKAYARAPGADDAAYRLGRDEELRGHLADAVRTFYAATAMPDGGAAEASALREVWVLDTEMTIEDLRRMLTTAALPEGLALQVRYSLGVDLLRRGEYAEAATDLARVARAIGATSLVLLPQSGSWPFAAAVRVQAAQAETLATLDAKLRRARGVAARATAQYDLGAYMYHRTLLFYNMLWAGQFGSMPWLGDQPFTPTPRFIAFERSENNFLQAASRFRALSEKAQAPASVRALALFSYAMCLDNLQGYNTAVATVWPQASLNAATARAFATFAARDPESPLAPEALTLEAAFTSSRAVLARLVARYGGTAAGIDAKGDLHQRNWPTEPPPSVGVMPWRIVWSTTPGVPASIRRWAAAPGAVLARQSVDGFTYIRVRPRAVPPGKYPEVTEITEVRPGLASVSWGLGPVAVGDARPLILTHGYALVVVAGSVRVEAGPPPYAGVSPPVGSDTLY